MDILQIVILALIQGVTEFLPISSSAHLILPAQLTSWPDQGLAFDVALHLGSLLAVISYFRADILRFAHGGVRLVAERRLDEDSELLLKVVVAVLPVAAAGYAFNDVVESELRTVYVIAGTTIGFGLLLWLSDRRVGSSETVTWNQAIIIGLLQTLALIPGTSRSGITMTAALLLGISRTAGAHFSFLLSMPTIAGAALLSGLNLADQPEPVNWPDLGIGFVLAGVSAYTCIHFFMAFIERTGMTPYVIYRLALGAVLLAFFA